MRPELVDVNNPTYNVHKGTGTGRYNGWGVRGDGEVEGGDGKIIGDKTKTVLWGFVWVFGSKQKNILGRGGVKGE